MKIPSLICFALCFSSLLNAQDERPGATPPPLPPGPLIQQRAPEEAKWVIKISQPEADRNKGTPGENKQTSQAGTPASAPSPSSLITTYKSNKIMLRATVDQSGKAWQRWCIGDVQITIYPDGKNFLLETRPANLGQYPHPFYTDYSSSDFPGFEWISPKNYAGIKAVSGRPCIFFKDKYKYYSDDAGPSEVVALVDYETRYPVALSINKEVQTYTFEQSQALTIPALVQSVISERQKSLDSANRPR